MTAINITEAKAQFSALVDRAEAGELVEILRRGKAVARLGPAENARKPVDLAAMRALTDGMAPESEPAGDFVRGMREGDRY